MSVNAILLERETKWAEYPETCRRDRHGYCERCDAEPQDRCAIKSSDEVMPGDDDLEDQ